MNNNQQEELHLVSTTGPIHKETATCPYCGVKGGFQIGINNYMCPTCRGKFLLGFNSSNSGTYDFSDRIRERKDRTDLIAALVITLPIIIILTTLIVIFFLIPDSHPTFLNLDNL